MFAEFHAFQANGNRSCWECRRPPPGGTPSGLPSRGELWNYSADFFGGRTIERLDIAWGPVRRSRPAFPGPGQYDASPALAALLRTVPRDELGDRPGFVAGAMGAAATVVAAALAYGMSILTVVALAPPGTAVPLLGHAYYATMGAGLAIALIVIGVTLPLLKRMTSPDNARFE